MAQQHQGQSQGQHQGKMGIDNISYDLISVLYHCLQGAETYEKYIQDAEKSGNTEYSKFFRDVQQEEIRRAERCRELLSQYWSQAGMGMQQRRAA